MNDLETARAVLEAEGCTCVLHLDGRTVISHRRGVAPLLQLLDSGQDYSGFSAADKVVGKATAMLYRLLGVKAVWGAVMSESAIRVLADGGIQAFWERRVPYIINRAGTGTCPMEAATAAVNDPPEALRAIRETLKSLQS